MICTIWIREKGTRKGKEEKLGKGTRGVVPLRFPSYITTNDMQLLIQETFQREEQKIVIGLLDESQRYYPLSMIKMYPESFTKGIFTIIYLNDPLETQNKNDDDDDDHDEKDSGDETPESIPDEFDEDLENETDKLPSSSSPGVPLRLLDGYFHLVCDDIKSRTGLDSNKIGVYLQSLSQFSSTNDLITKGRFLSSIVYALHQPDDQSHQFSPPVTPDVNAIFQEIFDTFLTFTAESSSDEREDTDAVDITRLCRFLALFSGGLANENIKILYHLFDFDQDGLLSFNDISNCFREILLILSHLYGPMLEITQTYSLDAIALSLAQHVVQMGHSLKWENDYISDETEEDTEQEKMDYSGDGVLSLQQFYQWYSNTDHILYLPPGRPPPLASYRHISSAKKLLSLAPITCPTLKLCLQHYSEASFISSIGVYSSLILSFRLHQTDLFSLPQPTALMERNPSPLVMENAHYLMTLETITQHLFGLHDPLRSDCVAIEDIFASLSLFLNVSWKDRLSSYFEFNSSSARRYQLQLSSPSDACLDLLLTQVSMVDYLVSVLKTVTLFESSVVDDDTILHRATQLTRHALSTGLIPSQPHGLVALSDFAEWLDSNIDLGETEILPETEVATTGLPSPSLSRSIQEELKTVKEELGLVGFTAEDFMDLLGEYANAGTIALSDWLHIVALMNQLNSPPSLPTSSSSSELASTIFQSLSSLSSSCASSSPSPPLLPSTQGEGGAEEGDASGLEYRVLLSSLIMFCDSPVEDKIAVIFTVLSETIYDGGLGSTEEGGDEGEGEDYRRVTYGTFLFFLECVLTLLHLLSPSTREVFPLIHSSQPLSTEVIARETLHCAMRKLAKTPRLAPLPALRNHNFNMDEFCGLLWAMLEEAGSGAAGDSR
jgi:Ca2+-binding EF-hand superfamily protein